MTIATITADYADGYPRLLSSKGYVLINGRKGPIVGRVCMDQMMVDVTAIPNVKYGAEGVMNGENGAEVITVDELTQMIDTIGYEIACRIRKRADRGYQSFLERNSKISAMEGRKRV